MEDIRGLVDEVERARRDYLASVDDLTPAQGAFRPDSDAWSAAEITEHLVHAEVAGVSFIWAAADDLRHGRGAPPVDSPNRGLDIETVVARTWQPREIAPEPARPTWGGPLAYWAERLRACRAMVQALAPVLEGLDLERVIHPHPISGPLDARQRLQFLRFHMDRHRDQVARVRAAAGFPAGD